MCFLVVPYMWFLDLDVIQEICPILIGCLSSFLDRSNRTYGLASSQIVSITRKKNYVAIDNVSIIIWCSGRILLFERLLWLGSLSGEIIKQNILEDHSYKSCIDPLIHFSYESQLSSLVNGVSNSPKLMKILENRVHSLMAHQ